MPDADSFSCSLPLSRRRFLKSTALAGAALFLPAPLRADPYCPWPVVPPGPPVRIRGRVAARGRGLAGVAVTDGRTVVATEADGSFTLVADGNRPFVYCSIPAGYRIPQNPTGTARFYMPLRADARGEMTAHFDLEPLDGPDDRHAFLVLADPQTQDAYEM
ncbi:MAG: twin-arginine translocation signal domain-containing protein, partial [Bacteroidetes bacterium]